MNVFISSSSERRSFLSDSGALSVAKQRELSVKMGLVFYFIFYFIFSEGEEEGLWCVIVKPIIIAFAKKEMINK